MTSQTLLMSILSMDSYFRANGGQADPNGGLFLGSSASNIGGAQINRSTLNTITGFGASEYTYNGKTIISYRGTDFGETFPSASLLADVFFGWVTGFGLLGGQALQAVDVYESWTGHLISDGPASDVILTGHSLGGGLAGFIATLTGGQAEIFDNMPYAAAAAMYSLAPDASNVSAFATEGEVLSYARSLEAVAAALAYVWLGPALPAFEIEIAALNSQENRAADLGTHGWSGLVNGNIVNAHSVALLSLLQYAQDNGNTDWHMAAKPVLDALYSDDIGKATGLSRGTTGSFYEGDQLRSILAYSALDGTTGLVYGNTGAHALFDDADDIGAHYSSSGVAEFAKPIAEISTQFAGSLAFHKITDVDVLGGVIKFHDDTDTLVVDLGDNRWTEGGGVPDKIVGQENLVRTALGLSDDASLAVPLTNLMSTLWGTDDYKLIKAVEIDTTDTSKTIQVAAGITLPNGQQAVTLHVAGGGNDTITGSTQNDFVSGGGGNDQITGNGGRDLLAGGAGNDTFMAGDGQEIIGGGEGIDTVDYSQHSTAGITFDTASSAFGNKGLHISHSTSAGTVSDYLFSVEKIVGTDHDDTFKIHAQDVVDDTIGGLQLIDAGDGQDVLDLTGTGFNSYVNGQVNGLNTAFDHFEIVKMDAPGVTLDTQELLTTYYLGSGDDTVTRVGAGSVVYTGTGHDKIDFSPGGAIADLSSDDRIVLGGILTIHGGLRNRNSADIWANGLGGFVKYGLNQAGELVIRLPWLSPRTVIGTNGQPVKIDPDMYILNFAQTMNGYTGAGDITLASYDIQAYNIYNAPAGVDSVGSQLELLGLTIKTIAGTDSGLWHGQDPLVLDLDGDGLDLTYRSSISKSFDLDANYYAGPTAWVLPDDGFLVRDINGDGRINDGTEMFSPSGSGFQGLGLLDGNADGVVNAADNGLADFNGDSVIDSSDVLSDLKVWVDYNQDAVTQTSELHSLSEYGIVGLNLTTTPVGSKVSGNTVVETASFVRADGTTGMYGEVLLNVDNTNTKYVGPQITVTSQALSEPDLKGYGTLVSLHQALSRHPEYVSDVDAALASITSNDLTAIKQSIMPILYDWAMGSPVHQPDGSVLEGSAADPRNHTFIAIKDYQGHFKDYVYESSSTTVTIGGVDHLDGIWKFASGARVEIIAPENGALPDPTTLHAQYGDYISATPENVTIDGQSVVQTTYTYANGAIVKIVNGGFATSTILLGDSGGQAWSPDLGPKIGFYERYMGEKFELNVKPSGTSNFNAALAALDNLAATIDSSLNFLAVRLVVQDSIFSPIFSGMHYDVGSDSFVANGSQQLAPMYQSLFAKASTESDPIAYLASWKPFITVLLGNYSQGSDLRNTNGFLAKNIIGGFEAAAPSYDFLDAADALGVSRDLFVTGTGQMVGTDEADIFYINGATQTAAGGKGVDNYIFGQNIGNTVVHDEEAAGQAQSEDVLRFTKLNVADISATREGVDLLLTVTATGETIRIEKQFTGPLPGLFGGNFATDYGVTEIVFADGTVWQKLEMAMAVARALPSGGTVEGTSATDAFISGAGNDVFIGHGSSDLYEISANSGNDEINDLEDIITRVANDVVVFGDGLTKSDLIFERNAGGNDLTIRYVGKSGSLKIDDQFAATNTGPLGVWYLNQIEMFAFDDGAMLAASDIQDLTLATYQTSGNDNIYGFYRDDTIKGGLGNDYMSGGDGSDTYVINLGDGSDEIDDGSGNLLSGQTDTIAFGAGITQSDLTFVRAGNSADLTINVGSSGQSVKVDEQFTAVETGPFGTWYPDQVEGITFSNGSAMTAADIRLAVIASSETSGNDTIYGFHGDDVLQGGVGDDFMSGGNGNDTYVINVGDGHDEIYDNSGNLLSGQIDTLSFGAGITQADVVFSRAGTSADLLATIGTSGQTVKIDQQFDKTLNWWPSRIETFAFSDGSSMSYLDVMHAVIASSETAGNDTVYGFGDNDVLQGGTGDDYMSGGDGNDTYVVNVGDGHDEIYDNSGNLLSGQIDTLSFGSGITQADVTFSRSGNSADLLATIGTSGQTVKIDKQFDKILGWWPSQIETFAFSDGSSMSYSDVMLALIASSETVGNDSIYGFGSNDLLDGGAGNDSLYGEDGNDTYAFGRGYDSDTIQDGNGTDTVAFKTGISQSDLIVSRSGVDMVIKLKNPGTGLAGTEQLRIVTQFDYWHNSPIEQFMFADAPGSVLTREDLKNLYFQQAKTSGDDTIIGTQSIDTLAGGAGIDRLEGGDGNDTYIFNLGDGNDTIYDFNGNLNYSSVDTLQLGAGITTANTILIWQGADLLVQVGSGNDSIRVEGFFNWDLKRIENIAFVDGTVWNYSDIMVRIQSNPITGTTGANTIAGTIGPDTIDGLGGTDIVSGNGNADIFKFNSGYGQLTVIQSDPNKDSILQLGGGIETSNVSVAGDGVDITLSIGASDKVILKNQYNNAHAGVGSVKFSDGTIWSRQELITKANEAITYGTTGNDTITGTVMSDTIDGKGGNDQILGGAGGDVYIFNAGYGQLEIIDTDEGYPSTWDELRFGVGIGAEDIAVSQDGSDIILTLSSGGDVVRVRDMLAPYFSQNYGVRKATFADGTVWNAQEIIQKSMIGTSADETIRGTPGDNLIDAGGGHDVVSGRGGDDVYIFNSGYGQLDIDDIGPDGESPDNELRFGAGITPNDIVIRRNGDNALLTVGTAGDGIKIKNQLATWWEEQGVQRIIFANGTVWDRAEIASRIAYIGTDGDDEIMGSTGDDTLAGGLGDDTLDGQGGSDTYLYMLGDGSDTIGDYNGAPTDIDSLRLAGIDRADVSLSRVGTDLLITLSDGAVITVVFQFAPELGPISFGDGMYSSDVVGLEQIEFADQTMTRDGILASFFGGVVRGTDSGEVLIGTSGRELIVGYKGDDTLSGANGDYLQGGLGEDTYLFDVGDGSVTVDDVHFSWSESNILSFGAGITPDDIQVGFSNLTNSLVLTVGDGPDQVIIMNSDEYDSIDEITFADSTIWTIPDVYDRFDDGQNLTGTSADERFYGSSGADVIDGGGGDDYIEGNGGDDTFIFNIGYGTLTIDEEDFNSGAENTLQLGAGITTSMIVVTLNEAGDVILTIGDDGDEVILEGMGNDIYFGIQKVVFDDSTVWDASAILIQLPGEPITGTTGGDELTGTARGETIDGLGGTDLVTGNGGGDTFIFNLGYGELTIDETDFGASPNNVLLLGPGILTTDATLSNDGNGGILLTIGDDGDVIDLVGMVWDTAQGVQTVRFADDTEWSKEYLLEHLPKNPVTGITGDEELTGTAGADIFDGLGGNDIENGWGGNDTFIFNAGYGQLRISQWVPLSWAPDNVLQFGAGIDPGDVTKSLNANGDIVLTIGTGGDKVVLEYQNYYDGDGVQSVVFADTTVWTMDDLYISSLTTSVDDDLVFGTAGSETIDALGATSYDYVQGHGGDDTFVFNLGYGKLDIAQYNSSPTANSVLEFGVGIDPGDVTIVQTEWNAIELDIGTSGDVIYLYDMLSDLTAGVRSITFDDGTVWSGASVRAGAIMGSAGADTLEGASSAEIFDGTGGTDSITGGGGSDTYVFKGGYGDLTIDNTGGSDPHGTLQLGSNFTDQDLWFLQSGNDLVMQTIGESDIVTIADWFSSNDAKLSAVSIDGGEQIDSSLNSLISAMATFANDNPAFDPATATGMPTDTTLQTAIAAAWH